MAHWRRPQRGVVGDGDFWLTAAALLIGPLLVGLGAVAAVLLNS